MISEGSDDEIDENWSEQEVSSRLKHKEFREKLRNYYDVGISTGEVGRKDISELIPRIINNNY